MCVCVIEREKEREKERERSQRETILEVAAQLQAFAFIKVHYASSANSASSKHARGIRCGKPEADSQFPLRARTCSLAFGPL